MLKESRWAAVLSLLLCCLLNSQAYAVEESKKPANNNQLKVVSGSTGLTQDAKTGDKAAAKNAESVKSTDTAAPASVAKPVAAENKSAVSTISGSVAANGLQSLSVVESVLSLLLATVFLLVLIRGKIIKHHE